MNLQPADPQPSNPDSFAPMSTTPAGRPATVAVPAVAESRPAANDNVGAEPPNDLRNPLWIIAIGMACFLGASAVVMAVLH